MHTLVLIRHGQSTWNLSNRFTGWTDVDLTDTGIQEATEAGRLLAEEGLTFDLAYTSLLKRAIRTLWLTLDAMDLMWLPVTRSWKLNERHYGALQGLNKKETAEKFGDEQVHIWRRSYDVRPDPLDPQDERHPRHDRRYADIPEAELPATECLKDVVARMLPYWEDTIVPRITSGQRVLLVAHGNSLRALVKHLDDIADDDIPGLNIPTGMPLVYTLDADLKPTDRRYLGDPEKVRKAMEAVAAQGRSKS